MAGRAAGKGVRVRVRKRKDKNETTTVYKIKTFTPPIIEAGGATIKTDIDWEITRELWSNLEAPLDKLEMTYHFLKNGMGIEFLMPSGDMITYVVSPDEVQRFDPEKSYVRYYLCLHCSILEPDLGNGYATKYKLKRHIALIHRYQPILIYRCSSCKDRFEYKAELHEHREKNCLDKSQSDELLIPAEEMTWEDEPYWKYISVPIVYPYTEVPMVPVTTPFQEQADSWLENYRERMRKGKNDNPSYKWAQTIWVPQYKPSQDDKIKFQKLVKVDAAGGITYEDFVVHRCKPITPTMMPYGELRFITPEGTTYWDKQNDPRIFSSTSADVPNLPTNTAFKISPQVNEYDYEAGLSDDEPEPEMGYGQLVLPTEDDVIGPVIGDGQAIMPDEDAVAERVVEDGRAIMPWSTSRRFFGRKAGVSTVKGGINKNNTAVEDEGHEAVTETVTKPIEPASQPALKDAAGDVGGVIVPEAAKKSKPSPKETTTTATESTAGSKAGVSNAAEDEGDEAVTETATKLIEPASQPALEDAAGDVGNEGGTETAKKRKVSKPATKKAFKYATGMSTKKRRRNKKKNYKVDVRVEAVTEAAKKMKISRIDADLGDEGGTVATKNKPPPIDADLEEEDGAVATNKNAPPLENTDLGEDTVTEATNKNAPPLENADLEEEDGTEATNNAPLEDAASPALKDADGDKEDEDVSKPPEKPFLSKAGKAITPFKSATGDKAGVSTATGKKRVVLPTIPADGEKVDESDVAEPLGKRSTRNAGKKESLSQPAKLGHEPAQEAGPAPKIRTRRVSSDNSEAKRLKLDNGKSHCEDNGGNIGGTQPKRGKGGRMLRNRRGN